MGNPSFSLSPTFFMLILLSYSFLPLSAVGSSSLISVWPKPRTFSWPTPQAILLSQNFSIYSPYHQHLTPAVNRYLRLILLEHHHPVVTPPLNLTSSQPLPSLTITLSDVTAALVHGVNESYTLSIPSSGVPAVITAETVWGAMRGLESFSQLTWGNPTRVAAGLFMSDWPIYPHRGIMLDTSRNYFTVEDILRTIRTMSFNKMNVFHWHITDSHSFPLVFGSEPLLSAKGAYGSDMVYSSEDVKRVVQFGFEHGVRVMPEIDMPGNSCNWNIVIYSSILTSFINLSIYINFTSCCQFIKVVNGNYLIFLQLLKFLNQNIINGM